MNVLKMLKFFENPASSQANEGFVNLTCCVKNEEESDCPKLKL